MARPAAAHGRWLDREAGRAGVDVPVPVLPGEKPYTMQTPILENYTEGLVDAQKPVVLLTHEPLPKFSADGLNIRYRRANTDEPWVTQKADPAADKVKILGLDEGTEYEYQMQVVTPRGTLSEWTLSTLSVTAKDPYPPANPADVRYQGFEPIFGHVSQGKSLWAKPTERDFKRTRVQVRYDGEEWLENVFFVTEGFCYPAEYLYYIRDAFPSDADSFHIRLVHEDFSGNLSGDYVWGPYSLVGYSLSTTSVEDANSNVRYGPRFAPREPPADSNPYDPDNPDSGTDPGGSGTDSGIGLPPAPAGGNGMFPSPDPARWIANPNYKPSDAIAYDRPFVDYVYARVKASREEGGSPGLYKTTQAEPRKAVWSMSKHRIGRNTGFYLNHLVMFSLLTGSPLAVEEAADFLGIMRRQFQSHPKINGYVDFCSDQTNQGSAWNDKEDLLVAYVFILCAYLLWCSRDTFPQHQGLVTFALDWIETSFVPKWTNNNGKGSRAPTPVERTMHPRMYTTAFSTMLYRMTGARKWKDRLDYILIDLIDEFRTTTAGGTPPRFTWRFGAVRGTDTGNDKNPIGTPTPEHMGSYPSPVMGGFMMLAMLGTPGFSDITNLQKMGQTLEHCAVPGNYQNEKGARQDFYWWKGVGGPSLSLYKEHSDWQAAKNAGNTGYTVDGWKFTMNDPWLYNSYQSFNWLCENCTVSFMPFTSQAHADAIISRYRKADGSFTNRFIGPAVATIARRYTQRP